MGEAEGVTSEQACFRIGLSAVIERGGQYLLARRRDIGWWNLVGGGLEYGETVEQGLRREVREEIGAEIRIVRPTGIYPKPQKREVVLTFLCQLTSDSPPPGVSDEISEVRWFARGEFPDRLLPKHRQRLEDAQRGDLATVLRNQLTTTAQDQGL